MSTRKDFFLFFFFLCTFFLSLRRKTERFTEWKLLGLRQRDEIRMCMCVRVCVCVSLGLGLFFKRIGFLLVSLLRVLGEGGDTRLNGRCCWMNI